MEFLVSWCINERHFFSIIHTQVTIGSICGFTIGKKGYYSSSFSLILLQKTSQYCICMKKYSKSCFSNLTPKKFYFEIQSTAVYNTISFGHYSSILPICRIMLPIKIVAQEVQFVAWVEKRRYSSSPCSILLSHSIHSSRHIKETNRYQFSNPSFLTVIGSAFPIDRPKNPFDSRKQITYLVKENVFASSTG